MDRNAHRKAIETVLHGLNSQDTNPFILKGGTALMECYGLDRFSEDIDLDAHHASVPAKRFFNTLEQICKANGYQCRQAKATPYVQRAFITYGDPNTPLKVEVSHREKIVDQQSVIMRNGIVTYTISKLCVLKATAYLSRDKIRDLYDLTFISEKYFDQLSPEAKDVLTTAFEYNNLEQFDYLVRTQHDPLIDTSRLQDRCLAMMDKLGLLYDRPQPTKTRTDFMQGLTDRTVGLDHPSDPSSNRQIRRSPQR